MKIKENKSLFLEQFGDTPQLRVLDFLIDNHFSSCLSSFNKRVKLGMASVYFCFHCGVVGSYITKHKDGQN